MTKDESPTRFSTAWIREKWDYEEDNAPKEVLLAKLIHEYHIAIPGIFVAVLMAYVFFRVGASSGEIIGAAATAFGASYYLFFPHWWCSVLAEEV